VTFPETRGRTVDGTPSERLEFRELEHQREARREFRKHRHPGAWRLPSNIEYISNGHAAETQEESSPKMQTYSNDRPVPDEGPQWARNL
jgi:hypothetical protein